MILLLFAVVSLWSAVASGDLLFREDWAESTAKLPLDQEEVRNPDLVLSLYGPGSSGLKKSHHDWIENDPFYVWSGGCAGTWLVTLRHRMKTLDLSKDAWIRWRSRQSGFHRLRVVLGLTDGTWLVSESADEASAEWRVREFRLEETRWRRLNIIRISEQGLAEEPDLSRVREVGFTDLMPGGLSDGCSRVDWLEVYGSWAE